MARQKRGDIPNLTNKVTLHRTHCDQDLAVEFLARESHFPVGDLKRLYVDEMAKLAIGARIKSYLSIFAIRHVRKMLLDRGIPRRAPARPDGNPETGHPALPSAALPEGHGI